MKINYQIRLLADAEPGSGFGNELLNSRIPVNADGKMIVPASHLKGLMRENAELYLAGSRFVVARRRLFSDEGASGTEAGAIFLSDAVVDGDVLPVTVSRTAIGENGIAKEHSLRVTEAIPRGTILRGSMEVAAEELFPYAAFALLSVYAVGGKRNRGAGDCVITFPEHPELSPAGILAGLADVGEGVKIQHSAGAKLEQGGEPCFFRLHFHAETPLCLPETPLGKQNCITSGFAIPGSAVVGMLLSAISQSDPDFASALFNAENFRCWPLHPTLSVSDRMSCRISTTHKISKLKDVDGKFLFTDTAIEPIYEWSKKRPNTAMKGCDGILSYGDEVTLWRNSDMPRLLAAHAVHHGSEQERNLFTTLSLAVSDFLGLLAVPASAAEKILRHFGAGCRVSVGKSRTTLGRGILTAEKFSLSDLRQAPGFENRLFIVQSPLLVPDSVGNDGSAEQIMRSVIENAGVAVEELSGSVSIRFGWNSLKLGRQCGETQRLQARRIVSPGSVFLLKEPVKDLAAFLLRGLGDPDHGFGGVLPHPGIAKNSNQSEAESRHFAVAGDAAQTAYSLHLKTNKSLSPSQIAALMTEREKGAQSAIDYLDRQKMRTAQICDCWEGIQQELKEILKRDDAVRVLRIWHDFTVGEKRG